MTRELERYEHVMRPVAGLRPYEKNARTHPPYQINRLTDAIRTWGFTNPLLIDEQDRIIAGHGRQIAAERLGIDEVPCIVVTGLSEVERQALIIADNRLSEISSWDNDILIEELGALHEVDFDLGLIGFTERDLARLLGGPAPGEGLADPDDVPSVPVTPVSAPGDCWILGDHRLVCGDPKDPNIVARALNGVKPHLMVTDAPSGPNYDATCREAFSLFPGDVAYVWHSVTQAHGVQSGLEDRGLSIQSQIIWVKPNFSPGRGHYHQQHQPCWYATKKTAKGHWSGDRKQSTVWEISDGMPQGKASAERKPVECMKRPIENSSSQGHAVYDPFSAAFSTGIACEMAGRSCHAIELDPKHVDCGVIRWMNFTGRPAILEGDGRTFAELGEARKR